ncbi:MAG: hypothetical protein KL787_01440 [Taibaiella sp.]|nr:hypothetical protein [Taibaiella sp.]
MKIAIHHRNGSFSDQWINYCEQHNMDYKIVDCYSNGIVEELKQFDILLWHWHHNDYKAQLFGRQLAYAVEYTSIQMFPDRNTVWYFDDKIGQRYLLEAIAAPLIDSYVFYDKKSAIEWISNRSEWPIVFKLKGGAGSRNVKLIPSRSEALRLVNIAFGKGFSPYSGWEYFKGRVKQYKDKIISWKQLLRSSIRIVVRPDYLKLMPKERGYLYFQDFIGENECDNRIIVIGDKAFAIKRYNRRNDFRASGSGKIEYPDNESIDKRLLTISFEIKNALRVQAIAFDYVYHDNEPKLIEISFGFTSKVYEPCKGYWEEDSLNWHPGPIRPQEWIIEDLIRATP